MTTPRTPRELATRTFTLLRDRPSLAIPVLLADTLSFAVMTLEKSLQRPILNLFFSSRDSVLSSHSSLDLTNHSHQAMLLLTPFVWIAYFASGLFYCAALLATSAMARSPKPLPLASAFDAVHARRLPLLIFALKFFGFIVICFLAGLPLLSVATQPWIADHLDSRTSEMVVAVLLELAIARLILRPALRLLSAGATFSYLAFGAATITLLAQFCLALAWQKVPLSALFHPPSLIASIFVQLTNSLIGAVPYVFLFTALSILATPSDSSLLSNPDAASPQSDPDRTVLNPEPPDFLPDRTPAAAPLAHRPAHVSPQTPIIHPPPFPRLTP